MKRFITFGSIGQFRNVIRDIKHSAQCIGYDADLKEPIMDRTAKMPIIKVTASEKIHGTNAAVCYSEPDGFWVQSRKNIITTEKDNAACAFHAYQNEKCWMTIIKVLAGFYNIDLEKYIISVYFEWCGGSIQKNSAVSGLEKRAIIFQHFKVSPIEPSETEAAVWMETKHISGIENGIFNIMDFKRWVFYIDFNKPQFHQNYMIKIIEEIEPDSPIGNSFGIKGNVGEGIVCTFKYKDNVYKFKVKGEKHSKSKVKTLKPVDEAKEQKKVDFVNVNACTSSRLEQAWQTVFGIENETMEPSVKATGDFLKAVIKDVMKEEMDILSDLGLEPKEVNGMISKVARTWFMEQLDKESFK